MALLTTMNRQTPIRANRRKELIEATISVIAEHGYHGTTVSRVAKAAEVSAGLMNFHFESKDKLFEAVFKHMADEYQQVWEARIAASDQEPWALLQTMIASYFDREVFNSQRLPVWFAFWSDPDLRDKFRDAATAVERRYVQQLESQVGRLMEPFGLGDEATRHLVSALSAMIDGFWLQALLFPKTFRAEDASGKCAAFVATVISYNEIHQQLAALRKTPANSGQRPGSQTVEDDGETEK